MSSSASTVNFDPDVRYHLVLEGVKVRDSTYASSFDRAVKDTEVFGLELDGRTGGELELDLGPSRGQTRSSRWKTGVAHQTNR